MLFQDQKTENGGKITFVNFTYDEEVAFAEWVFDILSARWLHEDYHKDFRRFLLYVYRKKTSGRDLTNTELETLAKHIEHIEQSKHFNNLLPPWPSVMKNDGDCLRVYANKYGRLSPKEQIEALKQKRREAWFEVWEDHIVRKRVPECEFFGEDERQEAYEKLEENFWKRVDEVMYEFGCSRQEAIREAEDYMPRPPSEYRKSFFLD